MEVKSSCASAPGKVILFGEHAVVYGVTAISAALSDLRIFVTIESCVGLDHVEVSLHDLKGSEEEVVVPMVVPYTTLRRLCSGDSSSFSLVAENPQEADLAPMRIEFAALSVQASQGLMAICYLVSRLVPELIKDCVGLKVHVKSVALPIGAGLGSSAAFSVALAAALLQLRQKLFSDVISEKGQVEEGEGEAVAAAFCRQSSNGGNEASTVFASGETLAGAFPATCTPPLSVLKTINAWAYAAEVVIHGAPSGLDNTTSCYGGALTYDRNAGKFDAIAKLPDMRILLTNTKVPRSTKQLVAGVRMLHDKIPRVVKPIFDSIEGISQRFLELLADARGDPRRINDDELVEEIGALFRINQDLLNAIGVGHAALNAVTEASQAQGFPCKLTGAGGGGCAITLLQSGIGSHAKIDALKKSLADFGFETFHSAIAGDGVRWHHQ